MKNKNILYIFGALSLLGASALLIKHKNDSEIFRKDFEIVLAGGAETIKKEKTYPVTVYILRNKVGKGYLFTNSQNKNRVLNLRKIQGFSKNENSVELILGEKSKRIILKFASSEEATKFTSRLLNSKSLHFKRSENDGNS